MGEDDGEVLVAAAGEADDDQLGVELERPRERVRGLERRHDPLALGEQVEGGERLLVCCRDVLRAAGVPQVRVLGADAGVVEPRRDRVRVGDLAVVVREDRRARAVQDARPSRAEARRARRLDAEQAHVLVREEAGEDPDRVRAAADAGDHGVRQAALGGQDLLARLAADDGLEVAHDLRVGVRADAGADQVVRRLDVRDPVADRLARRLLERARPELHGPHLRAEEAHALHVRLLALHVLGAHVDDALEPEARADRGGGDAVLARAGLCDDALLAEAAGDQRLADGVVDLVRARVAEVLALEVDAPPVADALGAVGRGGAADVGGLEARELVVEGRVVLDRRPAALQLVECGHERLGDVLSAVGAERAGGGGRHDRTASSERTASTKARTRPWSFTPGRASRLRLASTHQGRTASTARRTLSGPSPPARTTRPSTSAARSQWSSSSPSQGRSTTVATRSPARRRTPSRPRWPLSSG